MSRGPDSGTLLRRALERSTDAHGLAVTIVPTEITRWASATFTGARHRLTIEGTQSARFDCWIARVPELDLPLRQHLVADVVVLGVTRRVGLATVTLEALTVEE